jgi:hypothetical protein
METKHTPGPWTYRNAGKHLIETRHRAVKELPGGDFVLAASTREADMRLIAAAPALLAALEQAVDESGWPLSGPTDWRAAEDGDPKWVCNARAAIAAAKGEG